MHLNEFKFPGKCYLTGEYAVLKNGPAIVLNLAPFFTATIKDKNSQCNFHPDSPAGKYWKLNEDFFSKLEILFQDPHEGAGGLGASSAQFLSLIFSKEITNPWEAWKIFRSLDKSAIVPASGIDVVAQSLQKEGIFYIDQRIQSIREISDLIPKGEILYIIRTNEKIPTHSHLQNLDINKVPTEELNLVTQRIYDKACSLGTGLNEYGKILSKANLVAENTKKILQQLHLPYISGAKGAGALGADLIIALVQKNAQTEFEQRINSKSLPVLYKLGATK